MGMGTSGLATYSLAQSPPPDRRPRIHDTRRDPRLLEQSSLAARHAGVPDRHADQHRQGHSGDVDGQFRREVRNLLRSVPDKDGWLGVRRPGIIQPPIAGDPRLGCLFCGEAEKRVADAVITYDGYVEADPTICWAHSVF